jgi:hypothetical protein
MSNLQAKLLALAAVISALVPISNPIPTLYLSTDNPGPSSSLAAENHSACAPEPCYTMTVPAVLHCPMLPALTTACLEPDCILLTTTTIPGPNLACPTTPTVTASGSCPTAATCRHGCEVFTSTVTGPAWSCAFGPSATSSADVSRYRRSAAPHNKSCATTTTVTRPLPCPLLVCPEELVACPLAVEVGDRDVVAATTAADCPVTVVTTMKCPTCAVSCPPLPASKITPVTLTPVPVLSTLVSVPKSTACTT